MTPSALAASRKYEAKRKLRGRRYTPEQNRRKVLGLHGLTPESYLAILESQGGRCGICGRSDTGTKHANMYVDHDHVSGAVRGLLCMNCNAGLGMFGDNVGTMQNAINYLSLPRSR